MIQLLSIQFPLQINLVLIRMNCCDIAKDKLMIAYTLLADHKARAERSKRGKAISGKTK